LSLLVDQDVLWLDIPVDDLLLAVKVLKTQKNLNAICFIEQCNLVGHDDHDRLLDLPAFLDQLCQSALFHVLHQDVDFTSLHSIIIHIYFTE
jgi:hypothetical protein